MVCWPPSPRIVWLPTAIQMAITTLNGVLSGARPAENILKVGVAMEAIGLPHSHFYSPGVPGAAVAPSPGINGAALTSYAGQIPWVNPVSGNSYLMSLAFAASQACTVLLLDRVWHNSGISLTVTTSQAITSPQWPARDRDGSVNGEGILVGLEFSAAGGAGTPTVTLGYTNSAGTSGRTATVVGVTTPNAGTFFRFPLQAGDTGVRSVQSVQLSATWTSGTAHLVAYRVLGVIGLSVANVSSKLDALSGGFVRLHDNTVPFLVQIPSAVAATTLVGCMGVTQG